MTKYRDLNAPPGQQLAEVVRALKEKAESSKTGAHGVKDMGEHGDVVWPGADGQTHSVRDTQAEIEAAQGRLDEAEEHLELARQELADAAANVVETRERLRTLEEETLPEAVAALEEADRVASERLTLALQQIQDAADVVVDASERLDEADRRLTSLNTRVDAVEDRARVYTSTPGPEAPVGSYWITATDHLYIRVPCEEVP